MFPLITRPFERTSLTLRDVSAVSQLRSRLERL